MVLAVDHVYFAVLATCRFRVLGFGLPYMYTYREREGERGGGGGGGEFGGVCVTLAVFTVPSE